MVRLVTLGRHLPHPLSIFLPDKGPGHMTDPYLMVGRIMASGEQAQSMAGDVTPLPDGL